MVQTPFAKKQFSYREQIFGAHLTLASSATSTADQRVGLKIKGHPRGGASAPKPNRLLAATSAAVKNNTRRAYDALA